MKAKLIGLSLGLIAVVGLGFYISSALSKESVAILAASNSMPVNQIADMGPTSAPFVLVQNWYDAKYGASYDTLDKPALPPNLGSYYGLYGLPSYDLLREYLKKGGYIGSPLGRSKKELYNDCLMYSTYTYQCQNGSQY